MKISAKQIFRITALVEAELDKAGAFDADGNLVVVSAEKIAVIVADVEAALKAEGLPVPEKIDKVIQGLPAIVALLG